MKNLIILGKKSSLQTYDGNILVVSIQPLSESSIFSISGKFRIMESLKLNLGPVRISFY